MYQMNVRYQVRVEQMLKCPCLYCVALRFSLNLVWNVRPVWPIYWIGKFFILVCIPLLHCTYLHVVVVRLNGI
jgi:hypothetical protein